MSETPLKGRDPRTVGILMAGWRALVICLALAVLLAMSGAFGSSVITLAPRIFYWVAQLLVGLVCGLAAARWLTPISWYQKVPWAAALLIAVVVTAPISLLIFALDPIFYHTNRTWADTLRSVPSVFGSSLVITGISLYVRPRQTETQTHAAASGAPPPKFLERLPAKLRGAEVWAVEAEDHYLRLHTSLGEDLILMRLSDAITELEGIEGAQTHRSWWVAKSAVVEAERGEGRAVLTLKDGAKAPVSRGFAKALREAGWF